MKSARWYCGIRIHLANWRLTGVLHLELADRGAEKLNSREVAAEEQVDVVEVVGYAGVGDVHILGE